MEGAAVPVDTAGAPPYRSRWTTDSTGRRVVGPNRPRGQPIGTTATGVTHGGMRRIRRAAGRRLVAASRTTMNSTFWRLAPDGALIVSSISRRIRSSSTGSARSLRIDRCVVMAASSGIPSGRSRSLASAARCASAHGARRASLCMRTGGDGVADQALTRLPQVECLIEIVRVDGGSDPRQAVEILSAHVRVPRVADKRG
jgi:hypothetical protein